MTERQFRAWVRRTFGTGGYCVHCGGAGEIEVPHPSGDPQLARRVECGPCLGYAHVSRVDP